MFLDVPRTDAEVVGSEREAVALLTDTINLVNEFAKKSGSSGKEGKPEEMSEQMAFLLQMMAQSQAMSMSPKPGDSGGGNPEGGDTSQIPGATTGDSTGADGDDRGVDRAAGIIGSYPAEFREALRNYFDAMEEAER
jgi:hypothetical protein